MHKESDHREFCKQQDRLRRIIAAQSGSKFDERTGSEHTARYKTPLVQISDDTRIYFPKGIQHSLSPYTLDNDHPMKKMISGYTGFVPRSRGIIGIGYPDVTNQALCDFTTEHAKTKMMSHAKINLKRPERPAVDTKQIYYKESGMVPHYTGHVPSEKYRYGRTFGHSTKNAISQVGQTQAK